MKLEFFLKIFKKNSNTKLHEKLSSESRIIPSWHTDGHDAANSHFS